MVHQLPQHLIHMSDNELLVANVSDEKKTKTTKFSKNIFFFNIFFFLPVFFFSNRFCCFVFVESGLDIPSNGADVVSTRVCGAIARSLRTSLYRQ